MAGKSSAQAPSIRPASGGPRNLVAMLNELAAQARASRVQQSADISVSVTPDGTILTLRDQSDGSGTVNSGSGPSSIVGLQFTFTQTTPPTSANIKAGIIAAFGTTGRAAIFGTVLQSTQFNYYVFPASVVPTFVANDIFCISLTLTSGQACFAVNIGPNRLF